jgi:hypothetical protein
MANSETDIVVICPHCSDNVLIEKLNCCIFRHGSLKSDGQQIQPHLKKELCDSLFSNNLIYGCGKPFQIVKDDKGEFIAIKCGYI